jgi:hypothetical protein
VKTPAAAPLVEFSAHVERWCYCGSSETGEAQIKIKPRLVNHSSRRVNLRTGPSARLVLAIYAPGSSRRWLSPTRPRYRASGKWLMVPSNTPGHLLSPTSFESHWSRSSLRPFGTYFDPDSHEGDLVFNVSPDLSLHGSNVRLAYRLHNGNAYFPAGGDFWQWRGGTDGVNF